MVVPETIQEVHEVITIFVILLRYSFVVLTFVLKCKSNDKNKHVLKSRGITLQTNVCLVKAMVYPEVTYRCESWTIKKDEH